MEFDYYRENQNTQIFELIKTDTIATYTDTDLPNGNEYFYRASTLRMRPVNDVVIFIRNNSHINSSIPLDTVAPCAPQLSVNSICEGEYNLLEWYSELSACEDQEIVSYHIYYKEELNSEFQHIDSIDDAGITTYQHFPNERLAGCYAVTAIDSFKNESAKIQVCVDSCIYFNLPNAFSPNNDGVNDFYVSSNLGNFIKFVDMKIFNRYGQEVFLTNDPDISWNGRHKDTSRIVSTGVYYYICEVHEPRIDGTRIITLTGFIHVFAGDDNPIIPAE